MVNWGRVITAMVTPFDAELAVNYQGAQQLAARLITTGSDGIVVSGTTGESPTLSFEEKVKLFQTVTEAVGAKAPVIAGTGSYNTAESIELTKAAERIGVAGILLVAPYYNKPSQEGLYQHFRAVAAATSLPVILYNVPGRTGVNINVATMLRLAEIKNIVAVKEASANLAQISEICEKKPADFLVYSGDDGMTLPILSVGGVGVISVAGHVVGELLQQLVQAYQQGQPERAAQLNAKLGPIFRALFVNTNPIMVKAACNLLGMKVGGLRLPLVAASPQEQELLREELLKLKLL